MGVFFPYQVPCAMFSRATSALTVYIPPAIYAAGSTIAGEVELDFRQLRDDNIDEVHVRLRGASKTCAFLS